MEPSLVLLALAVGYLIGAISFTRIVGHIVAPDMDFSKTVYELEEGSQTLETSSINATSLAIKAGPKIGMLTGLLDMLKIFIPTLAFKLWCPDPPYFLVVAAAGMAGHIWPVYYRFRGGSGISQIYGAMLVIAPLGAVVCGAAGIILGMLLRDAFIIFSGGNWLMIPWLWFATHDWRYVLYALVANIMLFLAMLPQMRKYLVIMREGGSAPSFEEALKTTPMGKGLYKMGIQMHLIRVPSAHEKIPGVAGDAGDLRGGPKPG